MTLWNTSQPTIKEETISKELAIEILNKLVDNGGDVTKTFTNPAYNSKYGFKAIEAVKKETERINNLIAELTSGNYLVTPEASHMEPVLDEDENETGEFTKVVTQEAVYFTGTTKTEYKAIIETELFDELALLKKLCEIKGFSYDTEWDKFIASYK